MDVVVEASPLPGFSKESLHFVKTALLQNRSEFDSFLTTRFSLEELLQFLNVQNKAPSIQFAISDLGRKILQIKGLHPKNHPLFQNEKKTVLVNDIVGFHDPEITKDLITSALDSGFTTIKIKTPSPDPQLASVLREICAKREDIKFRLDANQNWDLEKIQSFNLIFKNLPIEYIEEPFAVHSDKEINAVLDVSGYPIALDESITDLKCLTDFLKHSSNPFIIIKPMLLGNIFEISETLFKHRSSYKRVIITSSLEASVGLETVSFLAASLGDNTCAHGLNTGKLFRDNLIADNEMENSFFKRTTHSGSLITKNQLDQSLLKLL